MLSLGVREKPPLGTLDLDRTLLLQCRVLPDRLRRQSGLLDPLVYEVDAPLPSEVLGAGRVPERRDHEIVRKIELHDLSECRGPFVGTGRNLSDEQLHVEFRGEHIELVFR